MLKPARSTERLRRMASGSNSSLGERGRAVQAARSYEKTGPAPFRNAVLFVCSGEKAGSGSGLGQIVQIPDVPLVEFDHCRIFAVHKRPGVDGIPHAGFIDLEDRGPVRPVFNASPDTTLGNRYGDRVLLD